MFKCAKTGKMTKPNEPAHRLVTHIRNTTYTRPNYKTGQDEVIGHGSEIAREVLVCKEYYAECLANGFQPQVVVEKE
jgi:hypothetical protein